MLEESLLKIFRFLALLTLSRSASLTKWFTSFTSKSNVLVQQHLCELAVADSLESHLCPGLNAVANFANFTIFRFSFKFNKFCDFSLNSTRYTKIRCLNEFSVCCAEIYNFVLIDQQAPACRFYKIYDFSLTSRYFN